MNSEHFFNLKKINFLLIFAFFATFSVLLQPQSLIAADESHDHGTADTKTAFNIKDFIFHHIADAHEFTFWGHGDHWKGLYLPVILWTDNGLVSFSSREFQRKDDASVVLEKGGQRITRYHGKIYYASGTPDHGHYVRYDESHKVANARPLDFSITKNVFTILFSIVILLWIFISVAGSYRTRKGKAPKGLQSFVEPIILFVRDEIARPNLGHKYEQFMPYLLTVFFFIWFNNMLGLVPFFPGSANVTGNIAVTAVLAGMTFLITTFKGNKDYWKHIFWMPGVPVPMKIFLMPIELIGIFTKPFALAIRLFANITAGHILVMSLICLVFIFNSIAIAPASIIFAVFIGLIELLVAFIQAFIFTILSALFIGMAVEEHH